MKVLVIGKAKTGTTALASLIRASLGDCALVMEPKSVFDIVGAGITGPQGNAVIKIIFEHFNSRRRHLNAIAHGEFNFPVEKLVFIKRDVRDEMISRLMYFAKVLQNTQPDPEKWEQWISHLQVKERDPGASSFRDLCDIFKEIFAVDVWNNIVNVNLKISVHFEKFIRTGIRRDYLIVDYADLVGNELGPLAGYLGVEIKDSPETVDLGQFAYTRRSSTCDNWREFFTESDVALLRPIFKPLFGESSFTDWELIRKDSLNPDFYSGYVRRMALGGA